MDQIEQARQISGTILQVTAVLLVALLIGWVAARIWEYFRFRR